MPKIKPSNRPVNLLPILGLGALIVLLCVAFTLFQNAQPDTLLPQTDVHLNEIMTKNAYALTDDFGETSDWIELINDGDQAVNLSGWMLMSSKDSAPAYVFANESLAPGETMLVFASGRFQNRPGYVHHAAYKLAASGDTVTLYNAAGQSVDSVTVPALSADYAYARDENGDWSITVTATPGEANAAAFEVREVSAQTEALRFNELMAHNATYALNDGCLCDYVELYNASPTDLYLDGYTMSDDDMDPVKYSLDGLSIPSYGFLLIHLDAVGASGAHAPFSLNADGETLSLYNPRGTLIDRVSYEQLGADQALSFVNGAWTTALPPTPDLDNTAESVALISARLDAANFSGLYINEIDYSNGDAVDGHNSYDWVEIRNTSSETISLAGYGLSDNPAKPRKWQFPEDAKIKAGGYLVVMLSGNEITGTDRYGYYQTDFMLSSGEEVTLCTPEGVVLDRVPAMPQYGGISYGRMDGQNGFFYFEESSIGAYNGDDGLRARCSKPRFSTTGGLYDAGETVTVELTAEPDVLIFYTTDCTEPTTSSYLYSGPFTLSSNTVIRAAAFRQGSISSYVATETYLFGLSHGVRVVSLVTDSANLYDKKTGIMTNELKQWERPANVEIYNPDGSVVQASQGCGLALNGDASRRLDIKSFRILGSREYDESNTFSSGLFTKRDYENYRSFLLRGGGQDNTRAMIRDPFIDCIADATEVYYQESEPCVLYINGEFYAVYDIRERISTYSVCDFEGWDRTKSMDIIKANDQVQSGSNSDYVNLLQWIKDNPTATDENIAYIETRIDLDNYIDYMCFMVYSANQDVGVRRYRNANVDGLWRWIVFDQDFGFYNDTDSITRWMDKKGAGAYNTVENKLFRYIMSNQGVIDRYLTRFGELLAGPWAADELLVRFDALVDTIRPEMVLHCEKWSKVLTYRHWEQRVETMRNRIIERPEKIIGYLSDYFKLTEEEKQTFFGAALNR